jgi:hypothetical protein
VVAGAEAHAAKRSPPTPVAEATMNSRLLNFFGAISYSPYLVVHWVDKNMLLAFSIFTYSIPITSSFYIFQTAAATRHLVVSAIPFGIAWYDPPHPVIEVRVEAIERPPVIRLLEGPRPDGSSNIRPAGEVRDKCCSDIPWLDNFQVIPIWQPREGCGW